MLLRWLGDLLSPPRCAACSAPVARSATIFCPPCLETVERCGGDGLDGGRLACGGTADGLDCGRLACGGTADGLDCGRLACGGSADGVAAFGHYGGALATAIRRFKYEDAPYLARPLGALAMMACLACRLRADVIVPVPLHPRRLALRGYNQSALLGAQVASQLRVPLVTTALARVLDTPPQAEQSRETRLSNVERAFRVARPELLRGCSVAIIDDVLTTGATLRACGDRVLEAGATRVTSVVVARTMNW